MNYKKTKITGKFVNKDIPIEFKNQDLTNYSGLELFKRYLRNIHLNKQIYDIFGKSKISGAYPFHKLIIFLIISFVIGIDRLSNIKYLIDDPMVKRVSCLKKIPSRFTVIRFLKKFTGGFLKKLSDLNSTLLINQLKLLKLKTITIDIDGTIVWSRGFPDGSKKGYNPIKKGAFGYYPLLAMVAQTGQFIKILNRPGNVHDSNGSAEYITELIKYIKKAMGANIRLQFRHDGAFFSEKLLKIYENEEVEYATKVPFHRITHLKNIILSNNEWLTMNKNLSYFILTTKCNSWEQERKFLIVRKKLPISEQKKDFQLNLFSPDNGIYKYQVICTNLNYTSINIYKFMQGRSAQEKYIGELKSDFAFDKIPSKNLNVNNAFQHLSILSYNLTRSFQIEGFYKNKISKRTLKKTTALKIYRFKTLRFKIFNKAGKITRTNGKLLLNLAYNKATETLYTKFINNFAFCS